MTAILTGFPGLSGVGPFEKELVSIDRSIVFNEASLFNTSVNKKRVLE